MQLNGFLKTKWLVTLTNLNPLLFKKKNQRNKPKQFLIGNNVVEVASSVKLLGIYIDDQLYFSNICKSASKQLNALVRSKCFLGFEKKCFDK